MSEAAPPMPIMTNYSAEIGNSTRCSGPLIHMLEQQYILMILLEAKLGQADYKSAFHISAGLQIKARI